MLVITKYNNNYTVKNFTRNFYIVIYVEVLFYSKQNISKYYYC